jgi:hypothetical protein
MVKALDKTRSLEHQTKNKEVEVLKLEQHNRIIRQVV